VWNEACLRKCPQQLVDKLGRSHRIDHDLDALFLQIKPLGPAANKLALLSYSCLGEIDAHVSICSIELEFAAAGVLSLISLSAGARQVYFNRLVFRKIFAFSKGAFILEKSVV
jgi:hypothetical protein